MLALEPFTAYCECPRCKSFVCHRFRLPAPKPENSFDGLFTGGDDFEKWITKDGIHPTRTGMDYCASRIFASDMEDLTIHGGVDTRDEPATIKVKDEYKYEVIRQCACGMEWGQV